MIISLPFIIIGYYQNRPLSELEKCLAHSGCSPIVVLGRSQLVSAEIRTESLNFRKFEANICNRAGGVPISLETQRTVAVFLLEDDPDTNLLARCYRGDDGQCPTQTTLPKGEWISVQKCLDDYNQSKEETLWFGVLEE